MADKNIQSDENIAQIYDKIFKRIQDTRYEVFELQHLPICLTKVKVYKTRIKGSFSAISTKTFQKLHAIGAF